MREREREREREGGREGEALRLEKNKRTKSREGKVIRGKDYKASKLC